ncbi:hypothetical protein GGQ85_003326 [Nitrobacter vulgaris]|nr:hypothetical protein [Nitrobacter vulgaris]
MKCVVHDQVASMQFAPMRITAPFQRFSKIRSSVPTKSGPFYRLGHPICMQSNPRPC